MKEREKLRVSFCLFGLCLYCFRIPGVPLLGGVESWEQAKGLDDDNTVLCSTWMDVHCRCNSEQTVT